MAKKCVNSIVIIRSVSLPLWITALKKLVSKTNYFGL